jgi:hypothetical protein
MFSLEGFSFCYEVQKHVVKRKIATAQKYPDSNYDR